MHVIQIIEDETVLRELMAKKLAESGYSVLTAGDGAQGLEQALDKQPDLILLDIRMPQMTGFEMLKKLRARGGWGSRVPVVFLTNLKPSSEEERSDIEAIEPTAYLVKSETDLNELPMKVKGWLPG